jgi:hypothetical protein
MLRDVLGSGTADVQDAPPSRGESSGCSRFRESNTNDEDDVAINSTSDKESTIGGQLTSKRKSLISVN